MKIDKKDEDAKLPIEGGFLPTSGIVVGDDQIGRIVSSLVAVLGRFDRNLGSVEMRSADAVDAFLALSDEFLDIAFRAAGGSEFEDWMDPELDAESWRWEAGGEGTSQGYRQWFARMMLERMQGDGSDEVQDAAVRAGDSGRPGGEAREEDEGGGQGGRSPGGAGGGDPVVDMLPAGGHAGSGGGVEGALPAAGPRPPEEGVLAGCEVGAEEAVDAMARIRSAELLLPEFSGFGSWDELTGCLELLESSELPGEWVGPAIDGIVQDALSDGFVSDPDDVLALCDYASRSSGPARSYAGAMLCMSVETENDTLEEIRERSVTMARGLADRGFDPLPGALRSEAARFCGEIPGSDVRRFLDSVNHLSGFDFDSNEIVLADGHEHALMGVASGAGMVPRACYDRRRIIDGMVERDGMDPDEAEKFFEFNVADAWVGESTPVFLELDHDLMSLKGLR